MKIGHYVSVVSGQKGFERNVSGHIQVPLHAMALLRDAGHDVHLITNEFGPERSMPACTPEGIGIHYVVDPRNRGGILERTSGQGRGVRLGDMRRFVRQIKDLQQEHGFDLLHVWGFNRTAHLGGLLSLLGLQCPTVATLFAGYMPERHGWLIRPLWRRLRAVMTATSFVKDVLDAHGISTHLVPHGIVRDLRDELPADFTPRARHRVLFWRDLSVANGADVTMAVYDRLAPKYPDVSFDLAIRPHWDELEGVDELAERHANVSVHRFPYPPGVTLPGLLFESLCVLMPIRDMSIDPQFVVAESLACGAAVITTDQRSNPELVEPGANGDLVPLGDVDATTEALDRLLADRGALVRMGEEAARRLPAHMTWDRFLEQTMAVYDAVLGGRS